MSSPQAKSIITDYLAGRVAARDGAPAAPVDASPDYLHGFRIVTRERKFSIAGDDYRAGRLTSEAWAKFQRGEIMT